MTLEDFFTLTEMKDGFTTLTRVNELVSVMQKEKDFTVKNIGEVARQWSIVATTIAATENRQCLDLFVQLDGLRFVDTYLNNVQHFSSDTGNSIVEESILAVLQALEKLHIDNGRSFSSGILMTVKKLLVHSSLKVQDRAKALFDGWGVTRETDVAPQVVNKSEALHDGGIDISINRDRDNEIEEKHVESSREEKLPLDCFDASQSERVDEDRITSPGKASGDEITENRPNKSIIVDEKIAIKEEASVHHSGGIDDEKLMEENGYEKVGAGETSVVSVPLEQRVLSSGADVATTLESGLKSELRKEIDANNQGFCSKNSPSSESRNASQKDNWMDNKGSKEQDEECNAETLHESSGDDCRWGEERDNKTFSRIENFEVAEKSEEHSGDEDGDGHGDGSENDSDISKPTTGVKDCSVMSKRSDVELDYGMVDPLDIARQVAIEVEREVDCREPSCSSSDKRSGGGLRQPDSPDSTNRKQSKSIVGPCKKLSTLPNPSPNALQTGTDPVANAETLGVDCENCIYDMASSQVTEVAQEAEANMDKGFSDFDLNQEVCSEDMDMDRPMNQISTPIPFSRAAASGTPIAPLQFEGALGWKGSAATSAFRRIPEGDRSLSISELRNDSHRLDSLDFDLNVSEGGEDKIEDLLLREQKNPSEEESSIEAASPRRSEKLQLDLNYGSDGGVDALLDWRRDGRIFQNQNGRQSPSQSSSSSSIQPSLKNFDLNLNDQQFSIQDSSDHRLFGKSLRMLTSRTASDASAISIMGARVELKRKDSVPQTLPLPNGQIMDHSMELNLGRSGGILGIGSSIPYTRSPIYGFNSIASGSGMPFSSPMYGQPGGPIPYMVDSRGAPFVPQFMPSAQSFPHPTPFMMNMTAAGPSNGAGPSQHNFDLNSGLMIEGGGNRETGVGFRQFLNPNDRLRAANPPQASPGTPGLGLKRQEPDSGFESYSYPFNFKHHQPSWR